MIFKSKYKALHSILIAADSAHRFSLYLYITNTLLNPKKINYATAQPNQPLRN